MDESLKRILSLIPKKEDGKFVHGAKKAFCEKIGAPQNIVNEWEMGVSKSYRNYYYQISEKYGVSVEWLKGEDAKKEKPALENESGHNQKLGELIRILDRLPESRIEDLIRIAEGFQASYEPQKEEK